MAYKNAIPEPTAELKYSSFNTSVISQNSVDQMCKLPCPPHNQPCPQKGDQNILNQLLNKKVTK